MKYDISLPSPSPLPAIQQTRQSLCIAQQSEMIHYLHYIRIPTVAHKRSLPPNSPYSYGMNKEPT